MATLRELPQPGRRVARRWLVRARDERGQSLLEFALASVVFFVTVFGTIEFGLAVYQSNMVSDLAQEGARWASVHGSSSSSPATAAQLLTFVQGRSPGFTVTVTATPANPSAVAPGGTISVLVSSTFAPATALIPSATLTLQSTAKMIVSR
jgi:Flp pilus assembly protein TadG